MASWPTLEDVKANYNALDQGSAFDDMIRRALARAKHRIRGKLLPLYNVALWGDDSDSVPPDLVELVYPLVYGFVRRKPHVGGQKSSSDQSGDDQIKEARSQLQRYASGADRFTDDDGNEVGQRSFSNGTNKLTEPVFGERDPIQWRISAAGASTTPINPDLQGII